jgi:hypothetical protein
LSIIILLHLRFWLVCAQICLSLRTCARGECECCGYGNSRERDEFNSVHANLFVFLLPRFFWLLCRTPWGGGVWQVRTDQSLMQRTPRSLITLSFVTCRLLLPR